MIGYTHYDHAGWVASNIDATRRNLERAAAERAAAGKPPLKGKAPEKGWLTAPVPLPRWQQQAMHILGMTFGGIYNAPILWDAVDWGDGRHLHVPIQHSMATFDHSSLTAFVFLCHDAAIRGLIAPHTNRLLRISMWPRQRIGGTDERHPTLYEAMRAFSDALPANHPVHFGYEEPTEDGA